MSTIISYAEFEKVELRVGTIIEVNDFPEARKPAYKLTIDFWADIGIKKSSAPITVHYTPEELVGRQIIAVVNFAPKQIGPFISECLTTGCDDGTGGIILLGLDKKVPNGSTVF